jgi:hypothetical protein
VLHEEERVLHEEERVLHEEERVLHEEERAPAGGLVGACPQVWCMSTRT